jgi:hypothetical protein
MISAAGGLMVLAFDRSEKSSMRLRAYKMMV